MTEAKPEATTDERQWVRENPLRAWRVQHGKSIMATAGALGASMTSIRLWEYGVHTPTEGPMTKIADLMGEEEPRLTTRWAHWRSRRPGELGD